MSGGVKSLPFEAPVEDLERQIAALRERPDAQMYEGELEALQQSRDTILQKLYQSLSAWDTVRVARHPNRPQTADYIEMICRDFRELHGDRHFGDDPAIVTGFARIGSHKVLLVGHRKGRTTQERVECHFGCAHPEGYRKALQKMLLAEKFGLPIVCLIDTPGAYPGIKAEERGQAQAIATNLLKMSRLRTPIVCAVIGEGGSGGALGIAVGDRVGMLEHAWYSVISPEGCAAILWKVANDKTNEQAATALSLTATDNLRNGLVDAIIPEPVGGAHRDRPAAAAHLERWIGDELEGLARINPQTLVQRRFEKFRNMGVIIDEPRADSVDH